MMVFIKSMAKKVRKKLPQSHRVTESNMKGIKIVNIDGSDEAVCFHALCLCASVATC